MLNGISLEVAEAQLHIARRMKLAASLSLLLALAPQAHPADAGERLSRTLISGHSYVRLFSWGRAHGFETRWITHDKTLELSNRQTRLTFTVDPRQDGRQAQINGVGVWLAFPVVTQNGSAYISQTDLDATLAPVLSPRPNPPGSVIRTICLDPGHGGKDPGNQSGSHDEKKYTLLLAQEVRDELSRAGFKAFLTRNTDTFVTLDNRSDIARERKADLFVSLHFNSSGTGHPEVHGVEVYCLTPAGAFSTNAGGEGDTHPCDGNRHDDRNMLLAYQTQKSLCHVLRAEDRGVKRARYQVLRDTTMPGILIEGGFMTNAAEARRIYDAEYRHDMARAIVEGIQNYCRQVKG